MTQINNKAEYEALKLRIEELLEIVDNDTPELDKGMIELSVISNLVADYEETHFPIATPSLIDVIKLRMYEMGLNQVKLSQMLGVSTSRISEYLTGKSEPTLKVAREMNKKLNIDAHIILGI